MPSRYQLISSDGSIEEDCNSLWEVKDRLRMMGYRPGDKVPVFALYERKRIRMPSPSRDTLRSEYAEHNRNVVEKLQREMAELRRE